MSKKKIVVLSVGQISVERTDLHTITITQKSISTDSDQWIEVPVVVVEVLIAAIRSEVHKSE